MAALNATTTGTGLTLGAGEDRPWSPRRLMDRFWARASGEVVSEAPDGEAVAGDLDRARQLRDSTLWSTRSSRLG